MFVEAFFVVFGIPLAWVLLKINSRFDLVSETHYKNFETVAKVCGAVQFVLMGVLCFWKIFLPK